MIRVDGGSTPFPGYAALLPTGGAALVIAAGVRRQNRILSIAPLRYVGDRSYAFCLWHWPVLLIAASYVGHDLSAGVDRRCGICVCEPARPLRQHGLRRHLGGERLRATVRVPGGLLGSLPAELGEREATGSPSGGRRDGREDLRHERHEPEAPERWQAVRVPC